VGGYRGSPRVEVMNNIPVRIQEVRATDRARERPRFVDARRLETLMAVRPRQRQGVAGSGHRGGGRSPRRTRLFAARRRWTPVVLATHSGLNNLPVELARYPEINAAPKLARGRHRGRPHRSAALLRPRALATALGSVAVVPMVVAIPAGYADGPVCDQRVFSPEALPRPRWWESSPHCLEARLVRGRPGLHRPPRTVPRR